MIKEFIKYYLPHWRLFWLDFSCAFALAGLDLVFPVVVSRMIDTVLPRADLEMLGWAGGGLLLLYIIRAALQYVVDYWGHVLGTRMEYDMRKDMFAQVQKLSFSYFDNTKTGHLMSRIVNDLNEVSELAHHGLEDLFIAIVTLVGSFVLLMTMNWQLALITFALIPLMTWFAVVKNGI